LKRYSIHFTLIILLILQFSCFTDNLSARPLQENVDEDSSSVLVKDATHFLETGLGIFSAPFGFDSADWTRFGLLTGTTALLFTTDKGVKDFALRNHTKLNTKIFDMDSYHGNQYSLFLAWGIYGYGALAENDAVRKVGLNATEAFVYSGIITGILKILVGRRRPYAGNDHLFLRPFQISNSDYQALPSGHSTVSFAVSTVIAKSVDNFFWKAFWYGSAGMVAASRVYHNKHWLSDVFLGGVIGYTVGSYVVDFDKKEKTMFGQRIKPFIGYNKIGIQICLDE